MMKKLIIVLVLVFLGFQYGPDLLRPFIHAYYNSDDILTDKKGVNKASDEKKEKSISEAMDVETVMKKSRDKRYNDY